MALGTRAVCIFFFFLFLSFLSLSSNILWIVAPRWLNKRAGLTVMLEQPSLRLRTRQEHTFSIFFLFITACVLGLPVAFFSVRICICFFRRQRGQKGRYRHVPFTTPPLAYLSLSRTLLFHSHTRGGGHLYLLSILFIPSEHWVGLFLFFFFSVIFPFLF